VDVISPDAPDAVTVEVPEPNVVHALQQQQGPQHVVHNHYNNTTNVQHRYDNSTRFYPRFGNDDVGPRFGD
jgi:hypothetical protein